MAIRAIGENGANVELEKGDEVLTITGDDLIEFADTSINQLDRKAVAAKLRAEKAKAKGDELRDKVEAVLTDEFQTIPEITEAVDVEGLTRAKVTARLTQLVKAGKCHKAVLKTADKRKVNGYAAGPAPAEDADE
jgi:hypothetical protein